MTVTREYVAHTDTKKRVTLRSPMFEYYQVREYDNGYIVLEPRELVVPEEVSERTLAGMDAAVESLKKGKASAPVDLSGF